MSDLDLIDRLADGAWHSAADLGLTAKETEALHQRLLAGFGLEVRHDPALGLRLWPPLDLLDSGIVASALDARGLAPFPVYVHRSIDSTNRWLLDRARRRDEAPALCLAEHQSAGHGRHGRPWVSPYGRNLYLSLAWRFRAPPAPANALPLVCAVALAGRLEGLGATEIGLKWPNDLLLDGAKLGGLLLETAANGRLWVIGLGLNLYLPPALRSGIGQPVAQLREIPAFAPPVRNALAAEMTLALVSALDSFVRQGPGPFLERWARYDILRHRRVRLHHGSEPLEGECLGVAPDGALRLATPAGERRLFAGEIEACRWQ